MGIGTILSGLTGTNYLTTDCKKIKGLTALLMKGTKARIKQTILTEEFRQ